MVRTTNSKAGLSVTYRTVVQGECAHEFQTMGVGEVRTELALQ